MKEIIDYKFFLINCIYYYLMNDKNLLWDELNIRKIEWSVKENRPQDMAVSSSYVRAPTRQKTLEAMSAIAGRAFAIRTE
jgi:hypothetical protein